MLAPTALPQLAPTAAHHIVPRSCLVRGVPCPLDPALGALLPMLLFK